MSEVKRYDLVCYQSNSSGEWETYARMKASDSGDYVLHSDYEKLKAQLERAESVLEWFNKRYTGEEGIYAREYFKEKESK